MDAAPALDVDTDDDLCAWCQCPVEAPYLQRPEGVRLHVRCAKDYARADSLA